MHPRCFVLALVSLVSLSVQAQQTIRSGESAQGRLASGDAVLVDDESFYDLYLVLATPGEELEITLESTDFDAYLIAGDTEADAFSIQYQDDDGAGGTDAQLLATVGEGGVFWVLANSYEPGDTGSYVLTVRSLSGGGTVGGPDVLIAGDTVEGFLEPGDDLLPDESYVDVYQYAGTPGETITVTMESVDFDAFLSGGRMENGRFVLEHSDDDGGGGTDALLVVEVGFDGTYTLRANSLRAGETGAYTLTVESDGSGGGFAEADVIRPGQTASGTLGSGSPTLGDGSYYHFYEIVASPYEALEITLASTQFDAYLAGGTTANGAFAIEDSDDDGAGGTDAQLRVQAGADGRYFALANTYTSGLSGDFSLTVRGVGGGSAPAGDGIVTLALGDTVAGELTASDPTMDDGSHFDLYVYEGTPGEEIEITMASDELDTYLLLRRYFGDELENIAEDDDGGEGTDSRIRVTLDRSGTYIIGANTYAASALGRYTLSIARPDDSAPDAASGLTSLRIGQPVSGTLAAGDATLPDDSFVDLYVYRGTPGERVTVTLRSAAFNAYLSVLAVSGDDFESVGGDDDGAGGTDSQLSFTVEGSGVYAIRANSLSAGETGAYSLVVDRSVADPVGSDTESRFAGKWAPVSYEPSADYDAIRDRVRAARRLEATVASLNEDFPLPRNVPVSFEECGMINAQYIYRATQGRVRFCYELMDYLTQVLEPQVGSERLTEAVNGAYEFIMLHEAGHALRHQLDLPITGREEDVADQFAALTLIRQGTKGARAAIDGVLALQSEGTFTQSDYAGEHSLGPQRLYNVVCLVYGSDPAKYASLVGPDGLPEARAVRCEAEYAQVEKSFDRLLSLVYDE